MKFEKFVEDEAFVCAQCNYCRVCPTFNEEQWESASPRGRIYLIRGLIRGEVRELDDEIVEDFFKCTTCGACEVVCQTSIPLVDVWERARESFAEEGRTLPIHRRLKEAAGRTYNPYGEPREKRSDWLNADVDEEGEVLYFAGCTASYRMQELAKNTVEFLKKAGIGFAYAKNEEVCCGSPFFRTGQKDIAVELFKMNYEEWKRRGVKKIITTCAGCFRTIAKDYPRIARELGYEWDFDVIHVSQLVYELLSNGEVEFKERLSLRATYHDPCHLGRHMGVYEEPRKVLESLGVEIIEMENSRENSFCCGAGGGVKSQFKDLAMRVGIKRIKEAEKTGAEVIVSCCPFCKLHLNQAAEESGSKLRVVDLIELVNRCL